jgi:ectoine hydroxylase-related dioxygenase (phytanoyl-CoA dioxygenase family)
MHELRTSNDLLGDSAAIRARLDDEGYVFLRDVVEGQLVADLKTGMMAWLETKQMVTVVEGDPVWTGRDFTPLGGDPPELFQTGLSETLAFSPAMQRLYKQVLDEPGYVLPMAHYQFKSPSNSHNSHVHQDGAFTPGLGFATFWVPLTEIPEQVGGITIAPGLHRGGSLYEGGAPASLELPSGLLDEDAWHRADYRPGDLLVFAMYTPHHGLPNHTDRVRLSIDIRIQPRSFARPIIGTLTEAGPDHVAIAADSGERVLLDIDDGCFVYLNSYSTAPADPSTYVGRRVMATAEGRRALLLRGVRGMVPSQQ